MARGGDKWDDECCAVHDGTIADFRKLNYQLQDITQWKKMLVRSGANMVRVGKVAGGVATVALIGTGAGAVAAPAIGGAIGSMAGLSGAAATSHGLAVLGGGALAAGGLGMAGGTAAILLAAGALGGIGGGVLVNKYAGDIQGFRITKQHRGKKTAPRIIFINGFLSENQSLFDDWKPTLQAHFSDSPWYDVDWESKRLRDLGKLTLISGTTTALNKATQEAAKHAGKQAAKKLGPAALLSALLDIGGNPWWVAMAKAEKTGHLLADLISRTAPDSEYILLGHSLGAKVVYHTLQALAGRRGVPRRIRDVHLLGGAVGSNDVTWRGLSSAVSGRIYNYYSSNDQVLRILYRVGTLFTSDPIGRNRINLRSTKVKSHDVTALVGGHGEFKGRLVDYIKT